MRYYIIYNGQQVGPMSREQLLSYGLNPNSSVWTDGMPQWVPAYTIPDLMEIMPQERPANGGTPPPPPYCGTPAAGTQGSGKRVAAGILAILLGSIGVQYFYVNKIGGGFLTILLSLVTCGIWSVVTLVQGILMLTMTDEEFDRKYVNTNSVLPLF